MFRHRPVLSLLVRTAARRRLLAQGKSRREIAEAFDRVGDDGVEAAFALAAVEPPAPPADSPDVLPDGLTAAGEHPVIESILAWLRSPEGQAVIAALVRLLLAALAL